MRTLSRPVLFAPLLFTDRALVADDRAPGLSRCEENRIPNAVFLQISNRLAVRQIRSLGVDEVEIFQTMLGYADDRVPRTH